jgi:arrestin-related trafficking adapter 3/6
MRLSRPDETDSAKRRHFEISIDSPFNILSCRATQANIYLPAYDASGNIPAATDEADCGCPGAAIRRRNTPPSTQNRIQTLTNNADPAPGVSRSWTNDTGGLTLPTQAHVHNDPNQGQSRPMHLLRSPSFNPPAFDEDEPPPPLVTPPPLYDNIVSGDSNHALADYFARLADEHSDEDDRSDRTRIDHPLTPGGRVNRSMDIPRNWLPIGMTGSATHPPSSLATAAPVGN